MMFRAINSTLGPAFIALGMITAASVAGWSCGGGETHGSTFGGGGNGTLSTGPHNGSGGSFAGSMSSVMTSSGPGGDPKTCAQAAQFHTYIGCDFWPTVIANNVWSIFDYAVVVANTENTPATVTVQRGGSTVGMATVQPNSAAPIYLPWVTELKGADFDAQTAAVAFPASVLVSGGAYHLTTDLPVTVYQFSAIEYAGDASKGGPPGKDWSSCPGGPSNPFGVGCFSYSNDASLLLPATAMTGNYRVTGHEGWSGVMGSTMTITGTVDGTSVTSSWRRPSRHRRRRLTDTAGAGTVSFTLNAGDVAELAGHQNGDFGGSLVQASKPVQVLTGVPCIDIPLGVQACDHIEESALPAETLGKHYFISQVPGPKGIPVGQQVKLFGNVDGTNLSYPAGSHLRTRPTTIDAGQVVESRRGERGLRGQGRPRVRVSTFILGAQVVDPGGQTLQEKAIPIRASRSPSSNIEPNTSSWRPGLRGQLRRHPRADGRVLTIDTVSVPRPSSRRSEAPASASRT